MNVYFDSKFLKKIEKIKDKSVAKRIEKAINEISKANHIKEVSNIKKLAGHSDIYRYRIGNYRIGLLLISDKSIEFLDFDKRNDFYKHFP